MKSFQRMASASAGLLLLFFLAAAPHLEAAPQTDERLPLLHQIGVIPLQWPNAGSRYADAKELLEGLLPKTIRDARRFRVLNDDLVANLWQTPEGREELKNQFELHAFASLTVAPRGDVFDLTLRFLDPGLRTTLIEIETVTTDWLRQSSKEALANRLQQLVFRLFNRLPVDVSVTSVQGAYITLSGGNEQGVQLGDTVRLMRTSVRSLHPANGTWLHFNSSPLGTAQVIEVKEFTAVAKLQSLIRENAVEVGDGAKIDAIATRRRFARLAKPDLLAQAGEPETIIVPPLYQRGSDKDDAAGPKTSPATKAKSMPAQPSSEALQPHGDEESFWPSDGKVFDNLTVQAGPHWWKVKGPVSASGKFPLWLLNRFGVSTTRSLISKMKMNLGGNILFGETTKGSYTGYHGHAQIYWEDQLDLEGETLKTWRAGATGSFSGISVKEEYYGGGDWLRGGIFAGLGGMLAFEDPISHYDWNADFAIIPLNIGRFGYRGSQHVIESAFGWRLNLTAFRREPVGPVQFGGGVEFGDERLTLRNSRRPHIEDYSLMALARFSL